MTKYSNEAIKRRVMQRLEKLPFVEILPGEEWRVIQDYPDYMISSYGRVKREERLLPLTSDGRYVCFPSNGDGKKSYPSVASIVLQAFVGPPPPDKKIARHLDDNTFNNRLDNVAWGSKSDNTLDAIRNGKKKYDGNQNRGKIWITNGQDDKMIFNNSIIPEGWEKGRTKLKEKARKENFHSHFLSKKLSKS